MRRTTIAIVSAVLGIAAVVGIQSMVGATAPVGKVGPPALRDPAVPQLRQDLGIGEHLILVVGGTYDSAEEAETANAGFAFGELQGFYVARVSDFGDLERQLGSEGDWALVSAFRTKEGAEQFEQLASIAGADPVVTTRVVGLGGSYAGLGQEAAPGGSGPLDHPTRASRPVQP